MTSSLSPFDARWLTEVVRLHEARGGVLDDAALLPALQAAPPEAERRILMRAQSLGHAKGWDTAIARWRSHGGTILLILSLLALAGGFVAAVGVMGDGTRPVNVAWVLGGLLGMHLFSLALWLIGQLPGRGAGGRAGKSTGGGALLGRGLLWLNDRLAGKTAREAGIGEALIGLLDRHGLLRWLAGSISHLLWLLALLGALAGLLAMLATRRYGFVWETTILPAEFFVRLTAALGALPGVLGFDVPDASMVRGATEAMVQDETARRAWSSWLAGCLVAYGILPRLLFLLACQLMWLLGRRRMRLDLGLPYYALLRSRLMAGTERIGVVDRAPTALPQASIAHHAPAGGQLRMLVGVELGETPEWPDTLPPGLQRGPSVDSREERRQLLQSLTQQSPARLLIALDASLSPDRGTLAYVAGLAGTSDRAAIWLCNASRTDATRLAHWREALVALGLADADIMQERQAALDWLERAHD